MYHKVLRSCFALILAIGLVALQVPQSALAATTWTVTNNNDSGPGSLRQAILDASDGDTIDFDADYTITLSSQLPVIDKTLTINGNGSANTIVEASTCNYTTYCVTASYRVLEVGVAGDLTLDSLTIRHGRGGIYSAGTLNVTNSAVEYNYNDGPGGGIYSVDGAVSVINSTLTENIANGYGGGIFINQGTLVVAESIFTGNWGDVGGGIFNGQGTTTITDSTFSGNSAEDLDGYGMGGGIANGHILTVMNSTFSNNYAFYGGGIDIGGGTLTVMNTLFTNNVAHREGGGINNHGTATIEHSTFSGNTADYSDGGYYGGGGGILNSGPMTVTDSIFSQNSSANQGGGIQNYNSLVVTNSTFSSNNAVIAGGGIFNGGGPATITNSTFSSNSAQDGGGINNNYYATMTVENSTFSGNSSVYGGSGIQNFETLHLINTIIANSTSGADCYNDLGDVIATNINNLIEVNGSTGHMCGTPVTSADPNLGPLADNGGPTQTMALLEGSPAIDAGDNATCEATDQRGVARPQGAACDIGAFEFEFDNQSETVTIDFPVQGLPFPNGTNITTEYSDQGILFSSDDSDLPPEYQKSLGAQENYIGANEGADGTFYNLFRLIFIATGTVTEVSVTLIDSNSNPQAHTLTAFDAAGNIVDVDSFTEDDLFPDPFILTVSSSGGIAYVVAIEQPYGAEILNRISYTIEREVKLDVSIDIKPGSDTNPINLNSKGKTPVVILSTVDFDAPSMLDTTSLTFGKTGDEAGLAFCNNGIEDVNEDGLFDLVCHFYTQATGFQIGDLEGILKGETVEGTPIEGRDAVTILD